MSKQGLIRRAGATLAAAAVATGCLVGPAGPAQAATFARLMNENSGLVLAPATNRAGDGVLQRPFETSNVNQQWRQIVNSDGTLTYQLRGQIISGTQLVNGCLDLQSDADRAQQVSGAPVVVRPCDFTNSQRWRRFFVPNDPNAAFNLENKLSLMNLDIQGSSTGEFVPAIQNANFALSQDFIRTGFVTG